MRRVQTRTTIDLNACLDITKHGFDVGNKEAAVNEEAVDEEVVANEEAIEKKHNVLYQWKNCIFFFCCCLSMETLCIQLITNSSLNLNCALEIMHNINCEIGKVKDTQETEYIHRKFK